MAKDRQMGEKKARTEKKRYSERKTGALRGESLSGSDSLAAPTTTPPPPLLFSQA